SPTSRRRAPPAQTARWSSSDGPALSTRSSGRQPCSSRSTARRGTSQSCCSIQASVRTPRRSLSWASWRLTGTIALGSIPESREAPHMKIRDLFVAEVTRDIPPVVYFHQQSPDWLEAEVGEYIVTGGYPEGDPRSRRVKSGI